MLRESVGVAEAQAKRITKYECERCADDGMEVFEYDMRNVVASSSRKLRSSQGKLVTARSSQNLKAKLAGRTPKSLGKPAPKLPGRAFVHKGYRYCNERKGVKLALRDCSRRDAGCQARLFRNLARGKVKLMNEHNHPPMEPTKAENEPASPNRASPAADTSLSANSAGKSRKASLAQTGFVHKGYAYDREHKSKEKQYWTCKKSRWMQCRARLHTSVANGEVIDVFGEHNHPPQGTLKAEDDATSVDVLQVFGQHNHLPLKLENNDQPIKKSPEGFVPSSSNSKAAATRSKSSTKQSPCEPRMRHKGFVYHRDQLSNDGTRRYWYCSQKFKLRCLARVHTSTESGEVVQEHGKHVHKPVGRVDKKAVECKQEDTPKMSGGAMRRRTLGAHGQLAEHQESKKPRASVSVDPNNE
ncbi:FLYWCH-type zinc finger-containing protein 1 [Aphelenchoides avenae]|nr:FLYWCH-type zinc finger-containing protein 1 [Aphelenchus avenae]